MHGRSCTGTWRLIQAPAARRALQVLDNMRDAGFKSVRVFIANQWDNQKGGRNYRGFDVENPVGVWNDEVLNRIDNLMLHAHRRGLKLVIALHDRYSLGCWMEDAYVAKYRLPTTKNCGAGTATVSAENDLAGFYTSAQAAADMDRRFAHILDHLNPNFGSRPWSAIPEAILGFDIQNEGQAHQRAIHNRNWICDRARALKPKLAPGILLMTGGGAKFDDSSIVEHFACPAIDVVSVHSYDGDFAQRLPGVVSTARQYGKRVFVEEFGASGSNKASSLRSQIQAIQSLGVPWMVWQVGAAPSLVCAVRAAPDRGVLLCQTAHASVLCVSQVARCNTRR